MKMMSIASFYSGLSSNIKSTIWLTVALLITIIILSIKLNKYKYDTEPKGLMIVIEWLVDTINEMCKSMIGKRYRKLSPYIVTIAIFIFCANLIGLLGLTPPTASISVTLTLSLMTFTLIQGYGIKSQGLKSHLLGLFDPNPLFFPINLISEVVTPFSLAMRLFGNILSGAVIMGLVYSVLGWISVMIAPLLHCYFDIFSGFIQTLVFCMLSTVFIAGKLPDEELDYYETHDEFGIIVK